MGRAGSPRDQDDERGRAATAPRSRPTEGSSTLANGSAPKVPRDGDHRTQHDPAEQRERRGDERRQAEPDDRARRPGTAMRPASPARRWVPRRRFATGDTSDNRPKWNSTKGSVAACAASDTPRDSASHRARRPVVDPARRSRDAAAPGEEPAPSPPPRAGSRCRSPSPGRAAAEPGYGEAECRGGAPGPTRLARHEHHAAHECRAHDARAATSDEREQAQRHDDARRCVAGVRGQLPRAVDPMTAPTSAMFQPLMATTWLRPVAVKASATSRETRSRRPTRIADASPAIGSGTTRASDSSASRRTDSATPDAHRRPRPRRSVLPDAHGHRSVDAREIARELAAVIEDRLESSLERDPVAGDERWVAGQPGVCPPRPVAGGRARPPDRWLARPARCAVGRPSSSRA